jgi:hypothetical protein
MDVRNAQGTPLMAAVLVLLAVVILGSISVAFSGSVQF